MDAISDRVFSESSLETTTTVDEPSLLTVILDISPRGWYQIRNSISLQDVAKSLLVFLNGHLAINNSNQVAFIASSPYTSKFLYPHPSNSKTSTTQSKTAPGMYRQFKNVDDVVLQELNQFIVETSDQAAASAATSASSRRHSSITGAISMALTYTYRMSILDQSITTTTASAISTSSAMSSTMKRTDATSGSAGGAGLGGNGASAASASATANTAAGPTISTSIKSRILIVSANDGDDTINYIPLMNCIFTAQKLKVSIDVAKLGFKNSSYLQQASDATNGVYLHLQNPQAIIQVLSTAFFIEPNLRPYVILPANTQVNYKASCFITKQPVDVGFVCSVCLCIMSHVPESGKCPACSSDFDKRSIYELTREPQVVTKKKRKLDGQSEAAAKVDGS
ncbi:TFB4 [Candida theae]|uniref:General transcription and DNA repair factor IIH subunit TFB4 n=1 Tax=Candida theae TaxID=1198502 RepID=A0AAD5BHX4_9ASCO|nr:TFB4 [Candida theae]KAI5964513.1 TFB4 [Candida theae]